MARTNQGLTTMASITIEKRNKANGDANYRCKVRVKKNGLIIQSESTTFSKKEHDNTWGKSINEIKKVSKER